MNPVLLQTAIAINIILSVIGFALGLMLGYLSCKLWE